MFFPKMVLQTDLGDSLKYRKLVQMFSEWEIENNVIGPSSQITSTLKTRILNATHNTRGFCKKHNIDNIDISDMYVNFVFQFEGDYQFCRGTHQFSNM